MSSVALNLHSTETSSLNILLIFFLFFYKESIKNPRHSFNYFMFNITVWASHTLNQEKTPFFLSDKLLKPYSFHVVVKYHF